MPQEHVIYLYLIRILPSLSPYIYIDVHLSQPLWEQSVVQQQQR